MKYGLDKATSMPLRCNNFMMTVQNHKLNVQLELEIYILNAFPLHWNEKIGSLGAGQVGCLSQ